MGQSVEVVTSELHLAAERLSGAGQRLQDGLSAVDLETSNLLGSGWQGAAATAFEKYWDQWHNGAGQVVRALQTMSDALNVAARNYAATDENAGGALDGTMQGGGGAGGTGAAGSGSAAVGSGGGGSVPSGPVGTSGAGQKPDLAQQMNLGEVVQPMAQAAGMPAQVAGQLAGGLTQVGQVVAGAAQQAVQMATELAQQAEAETAAVGGEEPTEKAPVQQPAEPPVEPPAEREL